MCGIAFGYLPAAHEEESHKATWNRLIDLNTQRGPDIQNTVDINTSSKSRLVFFSSVLHMRGSDPCLQPILLPSGDLFCFNGEVFSYPQDSFDPQLSDTQYLRSLLASHSPSSEFQDVLSRFCRVMSQIRGPYAALYFHSSSRSLIYCRDPIGRRSLMLGESYDGCFYLSSVGTVDKVKWNEIEPRGVYFIALDDLQHKSWNESFKCSEWNECDFLENRYNYCLNSQIPSEDDHLLYESTDDLFQMIPKADFLVTQMKSFMELLETSVLERLPRQFFNGEPLSILFSGGLDCTVLASTVARLCNKKGAFNCRVELLNVAFENPRCIQAQARSNRGKENRLQNFCHPYSEIYNVPDRLTGRASFNELKKLFPDVDFKFIEINVPFVEYERYKQDVAALMYPNQTVMDLSIAIAFWFASRGIGITREEEKEVPYTSSARVVFTGLGADELLGGYSHHRAAFHSFAENDATSPYHSVLLSLTKDLKRLPSRNLARDDRLISSHGKELRVPFLCERVWNFCVSLPVYHKCDFQDHVPQGVGEKVWLRMVAKWIIGLKGVCTEKKRAIQFGAKTAKMTSNREKGDDILK